MGDKFPYLAKQINGPIAKCVGLAFDHIYEQDQEFLDFLKMFSVDNFYGKWLDDLGNVIGIQRPYETIPTVEDTFMFDSLQFRLDPDSHGFSTDENTVIDGQLVTRTNGGMLDNLVREVTEFPINDRSYRRYIKSVCEMKSTMSIQSIADVTQSLVGCSRFSIEFMLNPGLNMVEDIVLTLAPSLINYQNPLQVAFDKLFTVSPKITVELDNDFDETHGRQVMLNIIKGIVGDLTDFSVTYESEEDNIWLINFTVMLGSKSSEYKEAIKSALDEHFKGTYGYVISVVEGTIVRDVVTLDGGDAAEFVVDDDGNPVYKVD